MLLGLCISAGLVPSSARAQAVGNCAPALGEAFLNINNVRARILNNGGLFWRGDPFVYEVPQDGGVQALLAAGIWVGGLVDGELRVAAARYGNYNFWPGPLNVDGTLPNPDNCAPFDRIFKINKRDVLHFEATGEASSALLDWPWELGAPVLDGDGNPNNYNLEGGDRPEVLGHQTLWWVMNDVGNEHLAPSADTPPIGLEVQVTAFAASSADVEAIDNATLYRYKLVYRGDAPLEAAYVGIFVDPDLGNFDDDYVGSDTTRGLGFVYNADNDDEGNAGYGVNPPALGFHLLQGPRVGNGERLSMTSFMFYNNGSGVTEDPETASDYYNYMRARWKDGQAVTFGGNGRDFSQIPTNFMFSGDPPAFWSEGDIDGAGTATAPSDRRFVMATGPFAMQPGDEEEIIFSIVWARSTDNLASVTAMKAAADEVQAALEAGFEIPVPDPPAGIPLLLAPGDRAPDQPLNPMLYWSKVTGSTEYQVQLATDPAFSSVSFLIKDIRTTSMDLAEFDLGGLDPNTLYFWRVRAANLGGFGPWSAVRSFTTSVVTIVQGGVLTFSDGTPAFVEVVGPGGADPCGPGAGSTFGCAEVGGNDVWDSFNGTGEYFLTNLGSAGPEGSIGAFLPNDFEIRITAEGSFAYHPFTGTGYALRVPIEVWDIGPTDPFNANDPSDDVQLIVNLLSEIPAEEGECSFGYGEGIVQGRSHSDRLYAYYPTTTYADWEAAIQPVVEADPDNCPANPATAEAAALIDLDRGRPLQRILFVDNTGGAKDVADLVGTIIRFYTSSFAISAPIPSSPTDGAIGVPETVTFFWNAHPSVTLHHLQVSSTEDFSALIVDADSLTERHHEVSGLADETRYFWRIRGGGSDWSLVWSFTTQGTGAFDVAERWNMIGLPIAVDPADVETRFPNALDETFFAFDGRYVQPNPPLLEPGEGYWLRFPRAETVSLTGGLLTDLSLSLDEGWNMITGPFCTVPLASIDDPGGIIIEGTLFGYAAGDYVQMDRLEPGKGYWLRADAPGQITLSCSAGKGTARRSATQEQDGLSGFSRLIISDATGTQRTLYFGGRLPKSVDRRRYSLPPMPPGGRFDARFEDDLGVADEGLFAASNEAVIHLHAERHPVTIRVEHPRPGERASGRSFSRFVIKAIAEGEEVSTYDVTDGAEWVIRDARITRLHLLRVGGDDVPTEYTLDQNYPNPFNPVTTIRFGLPEATVVRLEVYDVLGRRVAVLKHGEEMEAGWHTVHFDARSFASGLYFYVIRAGAFRATRSMILQK